MLRFVKFYPKKSQPWPTYDEAVLVDDEVEIVIQINGKVRAKLVVSSDISKDDVIALAKGEENIINQLEGKSIIKTIVVPKKLVNFVVR